MVIDRNAHCRGNFLKSDNLAKILNKNAKNNLNTCISQIKELEVLDTDKIYY